MTQPSATATTVRPAWLPAPEEIDDHFAERVSSRTMGPLSYDPLTPEEHGWVAEADAAARELPEELAIR